jgi:hypothetical protein
MKGIIKMKYSKMKLSGLGAASAIAMMAASGASADIVHLDDVIIDGSLCVGMDCVNGESFGFDTIRLKENNLRIRFQDTSSSASFPSNDWQITVNDAANGGVNKFSIDDIDGGRTPFTIEAAAPTNSLYVDDGGRIGLGTSTPVVDLHIVGGNTPTLRLEQNGSAGFTPQTWDVAGNEAGFFIRDATNGSTLPFRIIPGADSNSLSIAGSNNVGLGTLFPTKALHVVGTDDDTSVRVENANTTQGVRELLSLSNKGGSFITWSNSQSGQDWFMTHENNSQHRFIINRSDTPASGFFLSGNGNLTIGGALTQNSNRHSKTGIVAVDAEAILAKIETLPISSWTYKSDVEAGIRHIGPMAQDFYALFQTGAGETGISTMDTSGVALAAIKALSERNAELEARLELLETKMVE